MKKLKENLQLVFFLILMTCCNKDNIGKKSMLNNTYFSKNESELDLSKSKKINEVSNSFFVNHEKGRKKNFNYHLYELTGCKNECTIIHTEFGEIPFLSNLSNRLKRPQLLFNNCKPLTETLPINVSDLIVKYFANEKDDLLLLVPFKSKIDLTKNLDERYYIEKDGELSTLPLDLTLIKGSDHNLRIGTVPPSMIPLKNFHCLLEPKIKYFDNQTTYPEYELYNQSLYDSDITTYVGHSYRLRKYISFCQNVEKPSTNNKLCLLQEEKMRYSALYWGKFDLYKNMIVQIFDIKIPKIILLTNIFEIDYFQNQINPHWHQTLCTSLDNDILVNKEKEHLRNTNSSNFLDLHKPNNVFYRLPDNYFSKKGIIKNSTQSTLIQNKKRNCFVCNKLTSSRCSRCKKIYYCSPKCQRQHWRKHKKICKPKNIM